MWFHESFQASFSKFTWFPFPVIAYTAPYIQICQTFAGISTNNFTNFKDLIFYWVLLFGPALGCLWIQKSGDIAWMEAKKSVNTGDGYRIEWLFLKWFGLLCTCTMNQTVASLRQMISQVQNIVHQVASNWDLKVRNGSVIGDQTTLFSVKI